MRRPEATTEGQLPWKRSSAARSTDRESRIKTYTDMQETRWVDRELNIQRRITGGKAERVRQRRRDSYRGSVRQQHTVQTENQDIYRHAGNEMGRQRARYTGTNNGREGREVRAPSDSTVKADKAFQSCLAYRCNTAAGGTATRCDVPYRQLCWSVCNGCDGICELSLSLRCT